MEPSGRNPGQPVANALAMRYRAPGIGLDGQIDQGMAERVALFDPPWFDAELNALGAAYYRAAGFNVVSSVSCALPSEQSAIEPGALFEFVRRQVPTEAEAVVFGGNGLRVVGVIAALERELERLVVSPNQALLWGTMRAVGACEGACSVSVTSPIGVVQGGHTGLNVVDLDLSKSFYILVLGLDVLGESPDGERRYAFLGSGGKLLLALWQQSEGRFDTGQPGLHHLSFQVADIEAVRRAEATLRQLGVSFHYDGIVKHNHGAESGGVFFEDPDGIRLEIYAPTGAEAAPAPTQSAPACGFF
jgi:lactoylglutathione lyase